MPTTLARAAARPARRPRQRRYPPPRARVPRPAASTPAPTTACARWSGLRATAAGSATTATTSPSAPLRGACSRAGSPVRRPAASTRNARPPQGDATTAPDAPTTRAATRALAGTGSAAMARAVRGSRGWRRRSAARAKSSAARRRAQRAFGALPWYAQSEDCNIPCSATALPSERRTRVRCGPATSMPMTSTGGPPSKLQSWRSQTRRGLRSITSPRSTGCARPNVASARAAPAETEATAASGESAP